MKIKLDRVDGSEAKRKVTAPRARAAPAPGVN